MAEYFHASLFKFNSDAFREIIATFNATVQDVSAKCWYDVPQDVFCLTCPQSIGPHADRVLGEVLSRYIGDELAQAEREDRPPKVRRFADSSIDGVELSNDALARPTSSSDTHTQRDSHSSPVLHFVFLEASADSQLKLFRLSELPDGFVEHQLPTSEAGSGKAVHFGFSCRTVRWSADDSKYVFNGRVGSPVHLVNTSFGHVIDSAVFISLHDQRSVARVLEESSADVPVAHWRFRDGGNPGIQRFLEGMGETEPEEPDAKPEIPADAAKFMNRSTLPGSATVRTRVPRRTVEASDSSDEEESKDSDEDTSDSASDSNFNHILTRGGNATSEDNTDDRGNTIQSRTRGTDCNAAPTFASLFQRNEDESTTVPVWHAGLAQMQSNTNSHPSLEKQKSGQPPIPYSASTNPSDEAENSSTPAEEIPTYDRKYAAVDKIGLTSIAANQAAWEHENASPRRPPPNCSGIARRQPSQSSYAASPRPTSGSSAVMSISTGPDLRRGQQAPTSITTSSSVAGPSTIRNNANTLPVHDPWANNIVGRTLPSTKLIDDSSAPSKAPVKLPPGLGMSNTRSIDGPHRSMAQVLVQHGNSDGNMTQTLIDFSDSEPENTRPTVKLPNMPMNKPLRPTGNTRNAVISHENYAGNDDDQIIERLQLDVEEPIIKRNTMRQKKGRGQASTQRKKKKATATTPKVQLPKPDPVPPPKPQLGDQTAKSGDASQTKCSKPAMVPGNASSSDSETGVSQQPPSRAVEPTSGPVTAVEKLLSDVASTNDVDKAEIVAKFGMILVRHLETKDFQKGVYTKNMLQNKLRTAGNALHTSFFPRMTTSTNDAQYLLELIPGEEVNAKIGYDIHVKTSNGSLRVIKFDQAALSEFIVLFGDDKLGTLYVHYPMRVWDAQMTISKAEMDDATMGAASEFISSLQSTEVAPSFFAKIPPASFAVERVYAKKTFTKSTSNSVELRVAEIRDLILESVNSPNYNFKAVALPAEEMMESQRLWWECSLHSKAVDPVSAAEFQALIDDLVGKIDGVGFGNKGPWEKSKVENTPNVGPDVPFW